MMGKKLNHYDLDTVLEAFGIDIIKTCQFLDDWIENTAGTLLNEEHYMIEAARLRLENDGNFWNEEELKMKFVSVVLNLADLDVPKKIQVFYERTLAGVVNNISISVKCDCLVAKPKTPMKPAAPYFFLQEFKRTKSDIHDPEGQMLASMIIAQDMNADGHPLYGCWVQGKNWYFTVLNGVEYCVSRQFDATREPDLLQIVFILRKLKRLILARIK
jgi:hypothetical protein